MKDTTLAVHLTAKDTPHRLAPQSPVAFGAAPASQIASVLIDERVAYQNIEGFGGAFTEAAASIFAKLPPAKRGEFLAAYFDPQRGHGYTLCRTHINSCDFALGNYAYAETEGDYELRQFSIARDRKLLIPLIRQAMTIAGSDFKLFASPWSPPAWMKTNGEMNHGGKLKPECRQAWANYYCRYIQEYEREGIPIWGLTVQNEPAAVQVWDSCIYTAEEERDFVRDYLGPALHKAGLERIRLMVWDHNRDIMLERAKVVLDDPQAAKYVWGTAFHWYGEDRFDNVQLLHDAYPDKQLMFTEGCQEGGPHTGEWGLGERYARCVINDLNRWTTGWVDWNILLDEKGGPNHVGNLCSAPILANTATGELMYQSSYYYLGHFTRFVKPGAKRILAATTRDALETTAAINPDGTIAVIVLNRTDRDIEFQLKHAGSAAQTTSPAHSIMTLCIPGKQL